MNRVRHILKSYLSNMKFAFLSAIFGTLAFGVYEGIRLNNRVLIILVSICTLVIGLFVAYFHFIIGRVQKYSVRLPRSFHLYSPDYLLAASPHERQIRIKQNLIMLKSNSDLLNNRLNAIDAQFQSEYSRRFAQEPSSQPFVLKSEHRLARILRIAAAIVILLDILLSSFLSAAWLELPAMTAFIAGGIIAVIQSILCKNFIYMTSNALYDTSPTRARRKLNIISFAALTFNLVLIILVLLNRIPSSSKELLNSITGVSLGLLGISLPILAGALLALATDLDWSFMYESDFQKTKFQLAEINSFKNWLEDLEEDLTRDEQN